MGRPSIEGGVLRALLRSMAAGRWQPGQRLPGGRALAGEFRVSLRTIQKAVRRGRRYKLLRVDPRRRAIVQAGARERARRLLSRLSARPPTPQAAILVPERYLKHSDNAFYHTMIRLAIEQCARRGIRAGVVEWPLQSQIDMARSLIRRGTRAAAIIGFQPEYTASLYVLHEQGFPVMVFNRRIPGLDLPTVRLDDYAAAQQVADELASLGHRNLCLVTNFRSGFPMEGTNRDAGWLDRLGERGLLETCSVPLLVLPWTQYLRGRCPVFTRLFEMRERPTAMVFGEAPWVKDFLAERACARLRVPEEVSLVAFEPGTDVLRIRGYPPLSSAQVDLRRVAQCVAEMVESMLSGNPKPRSIRVPLKVTVTESVGPAPA